MPAETVLGVDVLGENFSPHIVFAKIILRRFDTLTPKHLMRFLAVAALSLKKLLHRNTGQYYLCPVDEITTQPDNIPPA